MATVLMEVSQVVQTGETAALLIPTSKWCCVADGLNTKVPLDVAIPTLPLGPPPTTNDTTL